ncbi:MAG TPA: hypothetical protein VLK33_09760 [Terriglobales bacterium]|nr:hypothetical protein [Terriglobales bacterium]
MRKALLFMLVLVIAVSVAGVTVAQDATPLTMGESVTGEISADSYEIPYTFDGKAGEVALIQMWQAPDASDYVDTYIILQGPDGKVFAENSNDPALYSNSVVAAILPDDGTYTVIAARDGGRTGDSVGPYVLVANIVEPLKAGSKIDATIYGYDNKARNTPEQFVVQGSGATKISFSQEITDLFPDLKLYPWLDVDSYPVSLFTLSDTSKTTSAVVSVDLEEGTLYILTVKDSFSSSVYDDSEKKITLTVG